MVVLHARCMTMTTPSPCRTVCVERVMGTVVSLDLRGAGAHGSAVEAVIERLHEIDVRFSTYRPDSEVSRYGRGELVPEELSADLRHVVDACRRIEAVSYGAFDTVAGGVYDPSAYVKGWAVDQAAVILDAYGCEDWSVNAGGDIRTRRSSAAAPWRVGVRHPDDAAAVATVVPAWELAVATSGRYERGDHVLDARSGTTARDAVSVTVCGPRLAEADAYATAAFVLGADGPGWVAGLSGYECWSVLPGGRVLATAGFPRYVAGVPVTTTLASRILEEAV